MNNLARNYVLVGLIWVLLGMIFGVYMGITQQLYFANTHAHANLVGFVTSVLFGLLHVNFPSLGKSRLAFPQFIIFEIGALILVIGKAQVDAGGADSLVKVGAIITIIGTAMMLVMFLMNGNNNSLAPSASRRDQI